MPVDCRRRDAHRHLTRAALRLALSVSVLVAVASWMAGCDEPQPPVASEGIPELTVVVGSTESVDLAGYFSDPDEDVLTYTAISSRRIATVSVSGAIVQVTAVAVGSATVTVTATDPTELSADQTFTVTVPNRVPVAGEPIEDIEVVVRETARVNVSGNFSDPDGDALGYTAATSDSGVVRASVSRSVILVRGVSPGTAEVKVTATDPGRLVATQTFTVTAVRSADWGVLEILYDELDGDNWRNNTNWKTDRPLGEWFGVSTGAGGRVVMLDLSENRLTGEIPSELGDLSNLEALSLGENRLTGEIPSELGDLSNLEALSLGDNRLAGEIPSELGDLSNLRRLSLTGNSLTGEIPSELGDLSNLVNLLLSSNSLTDEIPSKLGDLSNLVNLFLADNSLTGEIPSELGDLSNLEVLWLDDNSLTGEIPPELGNLSNLDYLGIVDNRLAGEIPSELGDLSSLEILYLRQNSLTGEIPLDFIDLSSLRYFFWEGNDGLCASDTDEFEDWLDDLTDWKGPRCD